MNFHLDIGSTSVKLLLPSGSYTFVNRDSSSSQQILESVKTILLQHQVSLTDNITVSSSANGGIRIVLLAYTKSLSGHVAKNCILVSGCNIIDENTKAENCSYSNLDTADKIILAVGSESNISELQLNWLNINISFLLCRNISPTDIIICANVPPLSLVNSGVSLLEPLLTNRLTSNASHLSTYLQKLYLDDLVDKKNIAALSAYLSKPIYPTPSLVAQGYQATLCGNSRYFPYSIDSIWLDIGGATTDIYYPQLSVSEQESSNIAGNSGNRHVLVSIGFYHSRDATLTIASDSSWYHDFVESYCVHTRLDFLQTVSNIVLLCIVIAILNACRDALLSFPYPINFNRISNIVITGGGAHLLDPYVHQFLQEYLTKRLDKSIVIAYDKEYMCLRTGYERI